MDNLTRNFSIIAHVDHGKSTLADRILEITQAVTKREMMSQILDDMDLERERGITIKARAVTVHYQHEKKNYKFNLIDTPGHVDFSYEVSRSLKACDGAILLVDASQGIEAQTLANYNLAMENKLALIPVLNKVDLSQADVERALEQFESVLDISPDQVLKVSAKTGLGIPELMIAIIERIPPPSGDNDAPLKALIFDSWHNPFRGVVVLVRIFEGCLKKGDSIRLMSNKRKFTVDEVGVFKPKLAATKELMQGDVGYVIAGLKNVGDAKVGDTITFENNPAETSLVGFQEPKSMVFASLYPIESPDYEDLKVALEKLRLNDSSFTFAPNMSDALGPGFQCGFLGLLHMEIVQERLEREFDLDLIITAPSVRYQVMLTDGTIQDVETPSQMPERGKIESIDEPYIEATIFTRADALGPLFKLLEARRGTQKQMEYITADRVKLIYEIPLNEVITDFHDKLKSLSRGYASMDYRFIGMREGDLVKMDILVNEKPVDALSVIVDKNKAYAFGRILVKKMKEHLPRHMFQIPIQAAIGSNVIARETVRAMRKNVTAKCYGGDITRKRKLLERQKEGKKRMKNVGNVNIPQDAFLAILKVDE